MPIKEGSTEDMAWNERFNHIDEKHFKVGLRTDEWTSQGSIKQDPNAENSSGYTLQEDDYESKSGILYSSSPVMTDNSAIVHNALKRKPETPFAPSSPSDSKKRQMGLDFPSASHGAANVIPQGRHTHGMEFGAEPVACVRAINPLFSRPYTFCNQQLTRSSANINTGLVMLLDASSSRMIPVTDVMEWSSLARYVHGAIRDGLF